MSEEEQSSVIRFMHEGTLVSRTEYSPEKVILGPGAEVIIDVTEEERTVGLSSAEGRSGFLVATENSQAHFLEMSPGLFSEEHAHPFAYIIYTIKGRWVMCSNEKRCVMNPGSICVCRTDVSMGIEVPFEEGAFVLYFLDGRIKVQQRYEEYMKGVSEGTMKHQMTRMVHLKDLPDSHPARSFADKVNLGFLKRFR